LFAIKIMYYYTYIHTYIHVLYIYQTEVKQNFVQIFSHHGFVVKKYT